MPKVMGLDVSSNTIGYSIIEYDQNQIILKKYGHIKPPASSKGSLSFRALKSSEKIKKLFLDEMPDEVVVEAYASRFSSGRSTARTIIVLSFFNELTSMICLDSLKYETHKYPVANIRSTISKHLNIKSISKEDVFKVVKNTFPSFNPAINKLGNISKESYDQADAIAVGFCHAINKQKEYKCQK
jgi:Holliday junction resolvasome RuvABC endonuclease subunit